MSEAELSLPDEYYAHRLHAEGLNVQLSFFLFQWGIANSLKNANGFPTSLFIPPPSAPQSCSPSAADRGARKCQEMRKTTYK